MTGRRATRFVWVIFVASVVFQGQPCWARHTLNKIEQQIVERWLRAHPQYRLATDRDCHCDEELRKMRVGWGGPWKPEPDYHPYVVTGDFNSDGIPDFAIVVVDDSKKVQNFTLLVFNGPFRNTNAPPAFVQTGLDGYALFFGPPRPKPWRLIMGPFESDNTGLLVPDGRTYKWE